MKESRATRVKLLLARYPLTLYFGILLIILAGTLFYLHFTFNWQINFSQFWMWINRHSGVVLSIVTLLLGLTLVGNAIAYQQTCHLNQSDYYLWLQQRATRTFFPVFTPLHDWLRLRFTIYRWWHTRPYASSVHFFVLILTLLLMLVSAKTALADELFCDTDLTITSNTSWSGTICYRNVTINSGGSLTIAGGSSVTLTSLTVGTASDSTGTITIQGDTINNVGVTMTVAGDVTVANGSTITSNARGYTGGVIGSRNGNGPGGGTAQSGGFLTTSAGGGGYGGNGGTVNSFSGGGTYGSSTAPTDLGSGGGFVLVGGVGSNGGAGGGALKITSNSIFTVDGTISANGGSSIGGGAGSGGSIWLVAQTCSGSGSITANGGNGGSNGGGGGGGRVYRQCTVLGGTHPTVTATKGTGGTGAADGTTVLAEITDHLQLSLVSPLTSGTSSALTVTAINDSGGTAISYRGTVNFTSTDSQASLPANYTFTSGDNGIKTFSVTLNTAGSATVTATDIATTNITGNTTVTVNHGAISKFNVSVLASGQVTAGQSLSVVVTAQDAASNTVTDYTGTISFSSTDPQAVLPSNYAFSLSDSGVKTFIGGLVYKTAGSQTLNVTQNANLPSSVQVSGTSAATSVKAAEAGSLSIASPPSSSVAGDPFSLTIKAFDAYGNVASGYLGKVSFLSSDISASLPDAYTFVSADSGIKIFSAQFTLTKTGTQSITVTDTNVSSRTATITLVINPAAISSYSVTTSIAPRYVNENWAESVTAKDRFGNIVTTDSTTKLTATTNGQAKFYLDRTYSRENTIYTLRSGLATLFLRDDTTESLIITVTDSNGIKGSSHTISVVLDPSCSGATNSGTSGSGLSGSNSLGLAGETCVAEPLNTTGPNGSPTQPVAESPSNTLTIIGLAIANSAQQVKQILDQKPALTQTTVLVSAAVPIAATLGFGPVAASLATMITGSVAQGGSALSFFITGLIPFEVKRRRRWGTVRHAYTGLPLPGVFVTLYDEKQHEVNKSLTDKTGRYGFLVQKPGTYQIKIDNPLYATYISKPIIIKDPASQVVIEDIALPPIDSRIGGRILRALNILAWIRLFSVLYWPLLIIGTVMVIALLLQTVTIFRLILAFIYLVVWIAKLLELRLVKPFGLVTDKNHHPLALAIVQLSSTDTKGRHIIHSTITDKDGRFLFTVNPGLYELVATKQDFEMLETKIDGSQSNITLRLEANH